MIFHGFPSLSELIWIFVKGLAILLPFILGGSAIYVLRKKKNAKNV
jgi:hypothetical protein